MKGLLALAGFVLGIGLGMWTAPRGEPLSPPPPAPTPAQATPPAPPEADPVAEIVRLLCKEPGLKEYAALAEPLARLPSARMGELIDRLVREGRGDWFTLWWLDRDPEAASKWIQEQLVEMAKKPQTDFTWSDARMIHGWARKFPEEALALARKYPHASNTSTILSFLLEQKAKLPPAEKWAWLRDFPESEARVPEAAQVIKDWAAKDPSAAFAAAVALAPGKTRDRALAAALPGLAAKDASSAFAQYERLGLADENLVARMVAGAASKHPEATAEWLLQLDPQQFRKAAPGLVEKWAAQDPAAAFAWSLAHPVPNAFVDDSPLMMSHVGIYHSESFGTGTDEVWRPNPFAAAMNSKPKEAIAWVRSLPEGAERERIARNLFYAAKADDVLSSFESLSPESQTTSAYNVAYKFKEEPARAVAWAGSLPAGAVRESAWNALGYQEITAPATGPDRDAWLAGAVNKKTPYAPTPEEPLALILEIESPTKRREVFDRTMESYFENSTTIYRNDVRKWMEKAKLPEEWKAKWRR